MDPSNTPPNKDFTTTQSQFDLAFEMKEEGNKFFIQKDYSKALSKYARVFLFTKALIPETANSGADTQQFLEMAAKTSKKRKALTEQQKNKIIELCAITSSNMAEIYLQQSRFKKALEKAKESINYKPTPKAYFRRGKAHASFNDFELAYDDLNQAKGMMPSMAQVIDQEMAKMKNMEKQYSKQQKKKYAGFFNKLSQDNE